MHQLLPDRRRNRRYNRKLQLTSSFNTEKSFMNGEGMKDQVPTNVINGIKDTVSELQNNLRNSIRRSTKEETEDVEKCSEPTKGEKAPEINSVESKKKNESFFTHENIGLCVAELIGTALLLFLGCMGCITEYEGVHIPHYMPAISFGFTILLIIQCFGHISGAHLNPAVTLATVMLGMLEVSKVPFYIIGQFAGALLGFASLKMLVPAEYVATEVYNVVLNTTTTRVGLCTTAPHPKVSTIQALVLETIITAVLILVCCGIWDKRNDTKQDSIPIRFGFVISAIAIAAGPFTGASMNTARSFAPALLNSNWEAHWIYWVGPTVGCIIAVLFYKSLYSQPKESEPSKGEELQELRTTNTL